MWNTVVKLMCLQQKASKPMSAFTFDKTLSVGLFRMHQTSTHCVCRLLVKVRVCDARGHRRMPPKYATVFCLRP